MRRYAAILDEDGEPITKPQLLDETSLEEMWDFMERMSNREY